MARKSSPRKNNVYQLTEALVRNGKAMEEGPRRKTWSIHDLKIISPLTPVQHDFFQDFISGKNICGHGSAGTGKTFIAIYLALNEILRKDTPHKQIIIIRSAVSTRDLGFMPGTLEEKTALYEAPYKDMFVELLGRYSSYDDMKEAGKVEFCTTSFVRGLTWDNAIVIIDESQNMTFHEINSIMTRVGVNTRIIVVGDSIQSDLDHKARKQDSSGLKEFIKVVLTMKEFSVLKFTKNDIVRSEFVKSWIVACEELHVM